MNFRRSLRWPLLVLVAGALTVGWSQWRSARHAGRALIAETPPSSTQSEPRHRVRRAPAAKPKLPAAEIHEQELPWEHQLALALDSSASDLAKAELLFALLPSLPEEALATAAQEAADRLPDAEYARVALPILADGQTHGAVLSVLFADLLERPDEVTLPALLGIARTENHPFAAAARGNLELFLNRDLGEDWEAWAGEVRRYLDLPLEEEAPGAVPVQ